MSEHPKNFAKSRSLSEVLVICVRLGTLGVPDKAIEPVLRWVREEAATYDCVHSLVQRHGGWWRE